MSMPTPFIALIISLLIGPSLLSARPCGTRWLAEEGGDLPLPTAGKAAAIAQDGPIAVGTSLPVAISGDVFLRSTTCRYVGEHAYIFVQDSVWDVVVVQSSVDRLGALFDDATPADSDRGVYEMAVDAFGTVPDVDGDERIFIFIIDMPDDRVVGYFDPRISTHVDASLRRDAVYLDAFHLNANPTLARGTLAHEFQHLIHWGHDPDEEIWIDEGLSGYAEALVGFAETDPQMVPQFLNEPDIDLTAWPSLTSAAIPHYGATYLFASFLRARYGPDLIRALVAEGRNGTFGIDEAFKTVGAVENFAGAWALWIAANYASDDADYGYEALRDRRVRTYDFTEMPLSTKRGEVLNQWGALGVVLQSAGHIEVEFDGTEEGRYAVWGYGMRGSTGQMRALSLDESNAGKAQWPGVDSVAIVVGRTSLAGGAFSLSARAYEPEPIPTSVSGQADVLPLVSSLGAAYPNPHNGQVVLPVKLVQPSNVSLHIYNSLGQRVYRLHSGLLESGTHAIYWGGHDETGQAVASGQYYAVAHIDDAVFVRGLTLLK